MQGPSEKLTIRIPLLQKRPRPTEEEEEDSDKKAKRNVGVLSHCCVLRY